MVTKEGLIRDLGDIFKEWETLLVGLGGAQSAAVMIMS